MPSKMEQHLRDYGHHFERNLNPKLYDEQYGDYEGDTGSQQEAEALPDTARTDTDMTAVRLRDVPQVPIHEEKMTYIEPLDGERLIELSDDELDNLREEELNRYNPNAREDELVDMLAMGMFLNPAMLSGYGLGAAVNQAKYTDDLLQKGYVRLKDYMSGAYRKLPQYVQRKGSAGYVPTSLKDYAAQARRAGYNIEPEASVGVWKHPKKVWSSPKNTGVKSLTREAEFDPTGEWINVRKPSAQLTDRQKIAIGVE